MPPNARPARARARPDPMVQDFPPELSGPARLCNTDCAAQDRLAAATEAQAAAIVGFTQAITPAVEAVTALNHAQQRFCQFIVGHRVKLVLSIPAVLVAIGAISPNAAHAIAEALKVAGVPS